MVIDARDRVLAELSSIDVGDARLQARAGRIAERLLSDPSAGFPEMMKNEAELEGFYRFTNNDRVDLQAVLAPHMAATHAAASQQPTLVVHDTTECHFSELVEGMGFIGKHPGFFVHTALAVTATADRRPLGVMGAMALVRPKPQLEKKKTRTAAGAGESSRWLTLIERVEEQAFGPERLIHVLDREGDMYTLIAQLIERKRRFVIRSGFDRRVIDDNDELLGTLRTLVDGFRTLAHREVAVCARDNSKNQRKLRVHPSRDERTARLAIRAGVLRIPRPSYCSLQAPQWLEVSFVHAIEDKPPEGDAPIDWLLITSETVETEKAVLAVVDHYRARWRIEEFFKALKTGCAFERRQSESLDALLVVLGLLMPIAWQLLALRSIAHEQPDAPATLALRQTQIDCLVATKKLKTATPTASEALWAVASLGGHLKRNGAPGWLTIGRGLEKLESYEAGWIAAKAAM